MLGRSYALSDAAAFFALSPAISTLTRSPLDPATLAAAATVCAGTALIPDLDHENGTLSRTLGPVSDLLPRIVARLPGGHRHATHSLLFAVGAGFGTWALGADAGRPAVLAFCLTLVAAALRSLEAPLVGRRWPQCWAAAAVATWAAGWLLPVAWPWLPWAVGLGCLAHLAGDLLTPKAVSLLWPIPARLVAPLLGLVVIVLAFVRL